MPAIKLSNQEITLLGIEQPELMYDKEMNTISGILSFNLKYSEKGEPITDKYHVEIDLNQVSNDGIPIVKETENRILNLANSKRINPADLHLNNSNGEMCIIIPPKAKERYPNGFNLKELLYHLQEHLYWVSYFEKHNKAPWKEYGHGELGYLQLYLEKKELYTEEVKRYFGCNSRPEFRRKLKQLKIKYKL